MLVVVADMLTAALFVISASFFRFLHIHSIWKSFSLMWAKDGPQNIKKRERKFSGGRLFTSWKRCFYSSAHNRRLFFCVIVSRSHPFFSLIRKGKLRVLISATQIAHMRLNRFETHRGVSRTVTVTIVWCGKFAVRSRFHRPSGEAGWRSFTSNIISIVMIINITI